MEAEFVRKHCPCEEIGDLKGQGGPVTVLWPDQVAHLIVDADGEASVNVKLVNQPAHGNQHQVEIIHCRALHNPIYPTRHEL